MTTPLISVVIPTYNSSQFVAQAVRSALAQEDVNVEVIVVDDGSTDDTLQVLEKYAGDIRYIRQENQGPATARNRGIAESTGEYVAFLDADDVWLPGKCREQVQALESDRNVALVHTDVIYVDAATEAVVQRNIPHRRLLAGECYESLFERNGITASSVMVRRGLLVERSGFDSSIRHASTEDYDLWLRLARCFQFAFVDQPLVRYRLHTGNATGNFLRMREGELYVLEKTLQADPALVNRIGHRKVKARLVELYQAIAYAYYDAGLYAQANRSFLRSMCASPSHVWSWSYWAATLLPSPLIRRLRMLKHSMTTAFQH